MRGSTDFGLHEAARGHMLPASRPSCPVFRGLLSSKRPETPNGTPCRRRPKGFP